MSPCGEARRLAWTIPVAHMRPFTTSTLVLRPHGLPSMVILRSHLLQAIEHIDRFLREGSDDPTSATSAQLRELSSDLQRVQFDRTLPSSEHDNQERGLL